MPLSRAPGRIGGWDAFIIPFRRLPLTEATNPVKVYEMLATGKPVVAVGLPELVPIARKGLIRLADTAEKFAAAIERELKYDDAGSAAARRSRLAATPGRPAIASSPRRSRTSAALPQQRSARLNLGEQRRRLAGASVVR